MTASSSSSSLSDLAARSDQRERPIAETPTAGPRNRISYLVKRISHGAWPFEIRDARCEIRLGLAAGVLVLLLGLGGSARASAPDTPISTGDAALFVDQEKIVEGPVTDAERDANTVRLRLGHPPQTLTVSLIIGLLSKFPPDPERYYLGKRVRVVGTIQSFRGAIEMVIHDPANIELADAPSAASGSGTASDTSLRDNVDALMRRVHELEEQVQQLQHPGGAAP